MTDSYSNHEKLSLSLLKYALDEKNMRRDGYEIFPQGGIVDGHEIAGLQKQANGEWWVFGVVWGEIKEKVIFTHHVDAIKFFYWDLTGPPSPWSYREEWERKTGMSF